MLRAVELFGRALLEPPTVLLDHRVHLCRHVELPFKFLHENLELIFNVLLDGLQLSNCLQLFDVCIGLNFVHFLLRLREVEPDIAHENFYLLKVALREKVLQLQCNLLLRDVAVLNAEQSLLDL